MYECPACYVQLLAEHHPVQRILLSAFAIAAFLVAGLLLAGSIFAPGVEVPRAAVIAFGGLVVAALASQLFGARYVLAPQA